jgi:ubiquinone/menaquinone biosynthesis C-methylase UbiE
VLSPVDVKRFYDQFGSRQDGQGFYENLALDDLLAYGDFADARAIVEFGCGTGRLGARLLERAVSATYSGFDVSTTMVELARNRLSAFGDRARVDQLEIGAVALPLGDECADRVVSTYVLDLLPDADIEAFFGEAHRLLQPGGLLCLVSLTTGSTPIPHLVASLWSLVFRLRPGIVGGCRPIRLTSYRAIDAWDHLHHGTVTSWAVSSEVFVARRPLTG